MNQQDRLHLEAEQKFLLEQLATLPEAARLTRASAESRLRKVKEQLAAGTDEREPARVRLTFRGRPVVGSHGVFAEFGTKAVNGFTEAVAAMAASLTGPLAATGPIPGRVQSQLLITNTALGSFGFELEEHRAGQLTFDETSPAAQALERTQKLLQATLGSDDELADSAFDADRRALDRVRAFLQTLLDNEAVCTVQYGDARVTFSDLGQVRTSVARLSTENLREEEQELSGELKGVLPSSRVFEFRLEPGGQVIRGKLGTTILDPDALNGQLRVPLRVKVVVTRVGVGRPRYLLTEVLGPEK
jgi:hypothetical protein